MTRKKELIFSIENLPMPPSINEAYVNVPGKGRAYAKVAKIWNETALWYLYMRKKALNIEKIEMRIEAVAEFYFCNPTRSDTNNYVKLLWDALKKADIIKDDVLIWDERLIKKTTSGLTGHVNIKLYLL